MKTRLQTFVDLLRDAGLPVTLAETLDAVRAVSIVGVERAALRFGLAATLLKDESDRATFDAAFDRCFPLDRRRSTRRHGPDRAGEPGTGGSGKLGAQQQLAALRPEQQRQQPNQPITLRPRSTITHRAEPAAGRLLLERRRLQAIPFQQLTARDLQGCDLLIEELARRFRAYLSRRRQSARRGRLDIRRTIRLSISKGGVPMVPAFRIRRPGTPNFVGLCDCSHSVATASRFLLGLLHPAEVFFRQVRLFAFVDAPIEISIQDGMLIPHARLDLHARSDFGRVLVALWEQYESLLTRNTILLVLGDARNNRRPPRADLLARIRNRVRRVVWLNPEPRERWNTGDSVLMAYRRYCDEVLAASTIQELHAALRRGLSIT